MMKRLERELLQMYIDQGSPCYIVKSHEGQLYVYLLTTIVEGERPLFIIKPKSQTL